jgi:hypothetical protein
MAAGAAQRGGASSGPQAETVIVDTVTLLQDKLIRECAMTLEGRELWAEVLDQLTDGLSNIMALDAHVFFVAHMVGDSEEGIMPMLKGAAKQWVPANVDEWVLLDVDAQRTPQRQFLLGPQRNWNKSGRNVSRSFAVAATVPALFEELGIPL